MYTFQTTYVLTIVSTVIGLSMIVLAVIWQILAHRIRSRLRRYCESLDENQYRHARFVQEDSELVIETIDDNDPLDDDIDIWSD